MGVIWSWWVPYKAAAGIVICLLRAGNRNVNFCHFGVEGRYGFMSLTKNLEPCSLNVVS
jgi:hypothetical protein